MRRTAIKEKKANVTVIDGKPLDQILLSVGSTLLGARQGQELPRDGIEKFVSGCEHFVLGNQLEASKCFKHAEKIFRSVGEDIPADTSSAMRLYSSALEKGFRMNYLEATQNLEAAKQTFEILKDSTSTIVDFRKLVEFYLIGVDNYLLFFDALNNLISWNFKGASETFEEAARSIERKLARLNKLTGPRRRTDAAIPPPPNYVDFFKGLYHFECGLSKLARAHHLSSNDGNNVDAERLCNEASSDMRDASSAFWRSKVPESGRTFSQNCLLIRDQFIRSYITHYRNQAKMQKEITRIKQERDDQWRAILEAAKMPSTVNVTQVATQLQQNSQIVQNIENAVKKELETLPAELDSLAAKDPEASQLASESREVLREQGPGFQQKAKNFLVKMKAFAPKIPEKAAPWIDMTQKLLPILNMMQ